MKFQKIQKNKVYWRNLFNETKHQRTYNLIISLSDEGPDKLVNGGPYFDDSKWGSVAGRNKWILIGEKQWSLISFTWKFEEKCHYKYVGFSSKHIWETTGSSREKYFNWYHTTMIIDNNTQQTRNP